MVPRSHRNLLVLITSLLLVLVVISLVIFSLKFPQYAKNRVIDALVFKDGSYSMSRFKTTEDLKNLRMSFYFYNITNPEEVVNNKAKIKLEQIGPFVYSEFKWRKFIKDDQEAGLITYKLYRRFRYNPDLSGYVDSNHTERLDPSKTRITWINIPLIATLNYIDEIFGSGPSRVKNILEWAIHMFFRSNGEGPFLNATVQELVFDGSIRPGFVALHRYLSNFVKPWPLLDNKFALLYNRNASWDPNFDRIITVSAGFGTNQTYRNLNSYISLDNNATLPNWKSEPPQCNKVGGTDGEFFSPFLNLSEDVDILALDICRRLSMKFKANSSMYGVPTALYVLNERTLESGFKNPENKCYCLGKDTSPECNYDGLIDLKRCNGQKSIFASGAHFWAGSKELLDHVEGLTPPDPSIHEPLFHIEPNTGLALRARFPLQFNVKLPANDTFIFKFLNANHSIFLPFAWIDESSEMTEEQSKILKRELIILDTWLLIMAIGGFAIILLAIAVGSTILCLRFKVCSRATDADPLVEESETVEDVSEAS